MDKITGYKFNLNTSSDVKRMLTTVANDLYSDKIDGNKARAITYVANTVISCIKTIEVEKRLDRLEGLLERE